MEENNLNLQEQGVSLGDIFGWIFKGKIPGLIVAGILFLLSFIAIVFIVSPSGEIYEVQFDYSGIPGLNGGTYIDGTKFNYQDIIVEENVNAVIENNKKLYAEGKTNYDYSTIDLEKLFESNKFTIDVKRIYWENDNKDAEPELKATNYIISLPPKAFKSATLAKMFVKDLIERPLYKTQEMVETMDFKTNLDMYNSVLSFDTKLDYLKAQVSLLENGFNSFNGKVGGTQYTIDGKTYNFAAIVAGINDFLSSQNYSTMSAELRQIGYVNDKTLAKHRYEIQMDDLVKEEAYLNAQLTKVNETYTEAKEALESIGTGTVVTTDQVLSLLTQLNDTLLNKKTSLDSEILANKEEQRKLQIKIDALNTLSDEDNAAFKARLDNIYERLVIETETYDKVYKTITTRDMYVYYTNSNVITTTGGMSAMIKFGAPVVLAIVSFVCVAWVYGYLKSKKEEVKSEEVASE